MTINEYCSTVALLLNKPQPTIEDTCTICGSISTSEVETHFTEGDAVYVEPPQGEWVKYIDLKNGKLFALYHLHDSNVTDEQYERIMGQIEDKCGNLKLYMKQLSKFYEHF
jgi:hypothetical protein